MSEKVVVVVGLVVMGCLVFVCGSGVWFGVAACVVSAVVAANLDSLLLLLLERGGGWRLGISGVLRVCVEHGGM